MFSLLFNTISFVISYAIPAIATFKTLKSISSPTTSTAIQDINAIKPWVIYWLTLSTITIAESHTHFILQFIPFYSLIKVYLSFWLILPQTKGALILYGKYFEPFMEAHVNEIEELVASSGVVDGLLNLLKFVGVDVDQEGSFVKKYLRVKPERSNPSGTTNVEQLLEQVLKIPDASAAPQIEGSFKEIDLVKSLGGVMEYLIARAANISETSTGPTDDTGLTKRNSNSGVSVSDFDLICKDEVATLKKEENVDFQSTKQINRDWFGFWSSSTTTSDHKKEE